MPGQRAVARAGICTCRGGIVLTHLALVAGAGGVQQLGRSDVRPGEADRKHQKAGSSKASLLVLPIPRMARGLSSLPCPGARQGWWATGTGLHRSPLRWGCRGVGWFVQPEGLGQCRQRWVGTGEGACFSSLSKCGLAAVGPAGRQHMIPAAWG